MYGAQPRQGRSLWIEIPSVKRRSGQAFCREFEPLHGSAATLSYGEGCLLYVFNIQKICKRRPFFGCGASSCFASFVLLSCVVP